MTAAARLALALLALAAGGCGDDHGGPDAAMPDAGPPDAGAVGRVEPPAAPALGKCPAGWRTLADATCEPWPETGRGTCSAGQAHFAGEPGCTPVGAACPAGDWAEGLPAAMVRHVQSGAPAGGTGAMDAPFATIAEGLTGAPAGTTVAIAKGTYLESVTIPAGVSVRGACAEETHVIAPDASAARDGVITVEAPGVVIRDLSLAGPREGLVIRGLGSTTEVNGVAIEGATASGVSVFPGARLTGSGLVVRDTVVARRLYGYGIAVTNATLEISRVVLERNTSSAISALNAEVIVDGAAISDTQGQPGDMRQGMGIEAIGEARVTLRHSVIEGSHDRAIAASEAGTEVLVEDSLVRGTEARASDGGGGNAAFVFLGAIVTLRRVVLEAHHEVAVFAFGTDTLVSAEDVIIRGTLGRVDDGSGGSAVALQEGAAGTLTRVQLEGNRGLAVLVGSGATLSVADLSIAETGSQDADGRGGTGLHVQGAATVEGARVHIAGSRLAGITAIEPLSRVTLTDVEIEGTEEQACVATDCTDRGMGDGVIAVYDATVSLERFLVRGNVRAGVHMADGGGMDLREGWIVGNAIGAVVQTPGFDVARISSGVTYVDNERNLDMSTLPVPEPAVGF